MHVLDLNLVADWLEEAANDLETWGAFKARQKRSGVAEQDLRRTVERCKARAERVRALANCTA